jgi:hypothetical protein
MLHYKPRSTEAFPAAVVVPVLDTLLQLQNARGMTVRQLSFAHAFSGDCGDGLGPACDRDEGLMAKNAVSVQGSEGVTLQDLHIEDVGGFGLFVANSAGLVIERVGVQGSGSGGIFVRSCEGMRVNNSIVRDYGQRYPGE